MSINVWRQRAELRSRLMRFPKAPVNHWYIKSWLTDGGTQHRHRSTGEAACAIERRRKTSERIAGNKAVVEYVEWSVIRRNMPMCMECEMLVINFMFAYGELAYDKGRR